MTVFATVAGFFGDVHRLLELTCHFRMQYLAVSVLCAGILLVLRDWRWGGIALLSVIPNAAVVLPWYLGAPAGPAIEGERIRLLLSNVHTSNLDAGAVLDLVRREGADVVVLQEVDDRWVAQLQPLNGIFRHSRVIPRGDNFGIGIWSRFPFTQVEVIV